MKHFIFDIDGTLLDTEKPLLLSWQKTLDEYGYKASLPEIKKLAYLPIKEIIRECGIKDDENIDNIWQQNYALFSDSIDYYDGLLDIIKVLHDNKNIKLGIVTSRPQIAIKSFLDKFCLNKYFEIIITSDDTKNHKPSPDPILKYIEKTGATKEDCFYFGDLPDDILSGKNAGVKAVLCKWNDSENASESDICHKEADYIFYHVAQILEL